MGRQGGALAEGIYRLSSMVNWPTADLTDDEGCEEDMPPRKRAREADADGSITLISPHETNPLQQALAAQWRKHQFCDITITVEDSSFKAHRCVLAACSDFMGSLLSGGFADSSSPTINLSEVPATAFEAALATQVAEQDQP